MLIKWHKQYTRATWLYSPNVFVDIPLLFLMKFLSTKTVTYKQWTSTGPLLQLSCSFSLNAISGICCHGDISQCSTGKTSWGGNYYKGDLFILLQLSRSSWFQLLLPSMFTKGFMWSNIVLLCSQKFLKFLWDIHTIKPYCYYVVDMTYEYVWVSLIWHEYARMYHPIHVL